MLRFPCNFTHSASGISGTVTAADLPDASVGEVNKKDLSKNVGDARETRGGSIIKYGAQKVTFIYDADFDYDALFHKSGLGVFALPLNNLVNTVRATRSYTMEFKSFSSTSFEDTGSEETDEVTIDTFWMYSSKAAITPES